MLANTTKCSLIRNIDVFVAFMFQIWVFKEVSLTNKTKTTELVTEMFTEFLRSCEAFEKIAIVLPVTHPTISQYPTVVQVIGSVILLSSTLLVVVWKDQDKSK